MSNNEIGTNIETYWMAVLVCPMRHHIVSLMDCMTCRQHKNSFYKDGPLFVKCMYDSENK
jgi:hypothetical protein